VRTSFRRVFGPKRSEGNADVWCHVIEEARVWKDYRHSRNLINLRLPKFRKGSRSGCVSTHNVHPLAWGSSGADSTARVSDFNPLSNPLSPEKGQDKVEGRGTRTQNAHIWIRRQRQLTKRTGVAAVTPANSCPPFAFSSISGKQQPLRVLQRWLNESE